MYFFRYPNLVLMDATYKTCKLSLPLFFLVVRTNVGYSVIAEFIVQHEDSQSIAEALGLLRAQWDANQITVGNFMIDCQQSEENAIRGIFPESVIFLCSFHRLQAWLRWLVNGKNGVAQYKDQCMSILRSLGESKTEDEYTRNLLRLQKSHVWSRFPNLRNYFTQQWAPKKKVNISENKRHCNLVYLPIVAVHNTPKFISDVGTGLPHRKATVRQHKQWDRGTKQSI